MDEKTYEQEHDLDGYIGGGGQMNNKTNMVG